MIEKIRGTTPGIQIERKVINTSGDLDRTTPLYSLGQKGIFEKEVDEAVLDGRVDFAVHSLKDLPVSDSTNLVIAGVLERASPMDVLVSRTGVTLEKLRAGSTVGTSSLLRMSQIRRVRPDLDPQPIRGNVETRVQKVDRGEYDAVILAEAGLARLGMEIRVVEKLKLEDFLPSPGQGIIAAVARKDNEPIIKVLGKIDHTPTRVEAIAEREFVRVLEGGCKSPIGALALVRDETLELKGRLLSIDGREKLETIKKGDLKTALELAREGANDLLAHGAKRLGKGWREVYA